MPSWSESVQGVPDATVGMEPPFARAALEGADENPVPALNWEMMRSRALSLMFTQLP
jgi:hypothetical protein